MAENFTESLESRIMDGRSAEDAVLEFSQIKVWLDMSSKIFFFYIHPVYNLNVITDRQIGTTIKYKLYNLYIDFQKAVYVDCNYTEGLANIPMKFNDAVYGSEDETYTVFMTPGMLLT